MKQSLLFLPDISGFTKFVRNTEIEHSQHIISELLEALIDENTEELNLAEIEGDALFFYAIETMPAPDALFDQIRRMYNAFHRQIRRYETHRICQCGACSTATNLRLKFFIHCGPVNLMKVKDTEKPFGATVIEAHRIMKNSVPIDEYILATNQFMQDAGLDPDTAGGIEWKESVETYDDEQLNFAWSDIESWKHDITEPVERVLGDASQMIWSRHFTVNMTRDQFFELLSNLKYRHLWNIVKYIEYDESRLNRAGDSHVCVMQDDAVLEFKTVHREYEGDAWIMGERVGGIPGYHYVEFYYHVHPDDGKQTSVEFSILGKPRMMSVLTRPIVRKTFSKKMGKSLNLLQEVADQTPPVVR